MANEQVILDGLDLNDQLTWSIRGDSFTFTPAKKKLNWATSALGDGAAQVGDVDHYENAELVFTVRAKPQVDKDTALGVFDALTQKLQEARTTPGGLPLVWAPADSSQALTFYVVNAEYDELHTSKEGGWFDYSPEMVCHLYLRPFGYAAERLVELGWTDTFSSDTFVGGTSTTGRWRFDTTSPVGLGAVGVAFDLMYTTTTTIKKLYLPWTTTDAAVAMRIHAGTLSAGSALAVIGRRIDTDNHIRAGVATDQPGLRIRKRDGGTDTTIGSSTYTLTTLTVYWVRVDFDGDEITCTLYADGPNPLTDSGLTALTSCSAILAGADATKFGSGVLGNLGIQWTSPTNWNIQDYMVRGMPFVKNAEPMVDFEVPEVQGHVPAEARLAVTEGGAKTQAHFEWGLEAANYNTDTTPPLILDSGGLTTTGLAGSQQTASNKYDPDAATPNMVESAALSVTDAVAVAGTGVQTHTGNYKVKARIGGGAGIRVRLAWRAGDGPYVRNAYAPPTIGGISQELDLGTIIVPRASIGTQSWEGRIEAYSPDVVGAVVNIDYLLLIPQERYGVARAPLRPIVPNVFVARDGFNQTGSTTVDNVAALETAASTGKWHSSGTIDTVADFTGVDAQDFLIDLTNHRMTRVVTGADASFTAGRYVVVGNTSASSYTAVQVQADLDRTWGGVGTFTVDSMRQGVIARFSNTDNWLMAVLQNFATSGGSNRLRLDVYKRVAGATPVLLDEVNLNFTQFISNVTVILNVSTAGIWQAYAFIAGTEQPSTPTLSGEDSVLATGNALQTGKVGLYDCWTDAIVTGVTRIFDNFAAFAATSDAVLYASKDLEVRSDRTEREAASGTTWGKVPQYAGSRFYLPPAGNAGHVSRMAAKARRLNVDEGLPDSSPFTDPLTIQVYSTPRYLHPVGPEEGSLLP